VSREKHHKILWWGCSCAKPSGRPAAKTLNRAAEIAKRAYKEGRAVLDVAVEMTDLPRDRLAQLLDPKALT